MSVVVPAYNLSQFIADSIRSVLAQTLDDLECIVVDDGSTDATVDIARSIRDPRLRVVEKVNAGTVADTRNVGIAEARGELVAFLDGDDWWFPEKLARQVAHLRANPEVGLVYCGYAVTDHELEVRTVVLPEPNPVDFRRQILTDANGIAFSSTAVVRAAVLAEVGGFNVHLSVSEDIDLADRIARVSRVAALPDCLSLYRLHGSQGHRRLDRYEHDLLWLLDDRFGRQGTIDPASWRRGRANLYTRLAIYELANRRLGVALRHARQALRHQPVRLAALPLEAAVRRARRRLRVRTVRRDVVRELRAARAVTVRP